MGKEKDGLEFHNFALRLPKELHKIVEDLAWENRTSVNIQIIDLLFLGLTETLKQSPKALEAWENEVNKGIQPILDASKQTLIAYFKENSSKIDWGTLVMQYPAWRNRK